MPHSAFQPVPQAVSQSAGLFVPQALLDDVRLKPVERNAWMMFRSLADGNGIATVSHELLRSALLCAPGSPRAALSAVSRAVLSLRLTAWIEQNGYRRDPRTGLSQGASYTVRTEPLSFIEACLGSEDYLPLLERGLAHTHVTVRELARDILDRAMRSPGELARLPPVPDPADEPASREAALAHLERIQAMLRGTASAMPSTGSLRPLVAFLTPAMETCR
jgi:hypothetical protein